jgi:DNA-binding IclR family transcriptional regulator
LARQRKEPVVGTASATAANGVAALDRAIALLRAFDGETPVLTLTDLATRTGLYKSTILRLANSLLHAGLLERLADGRYRIGPLAFQLGTLYRKSVTSPDVLRPIMRDLAEETGESVAFYVVSGNLRTCLIRVDSPRHAIRYHVEEGDALSNEIGSGGRVLDAFSGRAGEPYETICRDLVYVSNGERDKDTAGIAAPVFGHENALVGALTLAGPQSRFDDAFVSRAIESVRRMAALATRLLGGQFGVENA